MDVGAEVERLQLDLLAVQLSEELRGGGVPHALLKGPSTATWLYDPPRRYRDVDLLVPWSEVRRAARLLSEAGLATSRSGVMGEEAPHSWLLHSREGYEVDLHISLPALPAEGDRVWGALAPHLEPLVLDVGSVPALDEAGRCLVLALHAVTAAHGQPVEDLHRARQVVGAATWTEAEALATALGALDLFAAGIARVEGVRAPLSRRARLYFEQAPESALGIQRLATARTRDLPRLVWHELVPSRGFMAYDAGVPVLTGRRLLMAHARRWRRLARQLPAAFRALRSMQ